MKTKHSFVDAVDTIRRNRRSRWLVPLAIGGVVAIVASGVLTAQAADPKLPPRTAAELLADMHSAHVDTLSGTIVEKANLGLPSLPNIGPDAAANGSLWGMLTGSHTARIWLSGPNKQRVAVLDAEGETDVFRDGTTLWQWNASNQTATHTVLPKDWNKTQEHPMAPSTVTPQQAAQQALAAITPTTTVSVDSTRRIAGRAAYELVLTPKQSGTRVGSVHIWVDGETKIPLGVQVYPTSSSSAAIDVAFTNISFATPDDRNFAFSPPRGAHVKQAPLSSLFGSFHHGSGTSANQPSSQVRTIGEGWTSVLTTRNADLASTGPNGIFNGPNGMPNSKGSESFGLIMQALKPVSGSWGSGWLFDSKLITGLLTNDGRIYVGAVDPSLLYRAAATR